MVVTDWDAHVCHKPRSDLTQDENIFQNLWIVPQSAFGVYTFWKQKKIGDIRGKSVLRLRFVKASDICVKL